MFGGGHGFAVDVCFGLSGQGGKVTAQGQTGPDLGVLGAYCPYIWVSLQYFSLSIQKCFN